MKLTTDRFLGGGITTGVYAFAANIADQRLVPPSWVLVIARLVIGFEIFLGIWLLIRFRLRAAFLVSVVTLVAFTGYLILSYIRGSQASCGCMGGIGSDSMMMGVSRNVVLLSACGLGLRLMQVDANRLPEPRQGQKVVGASEAR
ncbi:MAG: hypothetical protein JNM86_10375 [Phycisphaerae bacterium]|nr:hypothetical protein [Phycisphaerae bacterium]